MMIFFPRLYEDELLYSALARYHKRSGNINKQDTLRDIYSSVDIAASVFLPSNIRRIVENMPPNCPYTEEYIINNHTLYPFYTAFSELKVSEELFNLMVGEKKGNTYAKIGAIGGTLKFNEYLKFCPECLKEDIEKHGETYWHRVHQVPGVLICPNHKVLLKNSRVKTQLFKKSDIIAADEYNCLSNLEESCTNYSEEDIDKLYDLSLDIYYIINNEINKKNIERYQVNYINYLMKEDLATLNKMVKQKELCDKFKAYYGNKLLDILNCNIEYDNDNWLKRITRKGKYSDDPIKNLLLIRFLGIKLKDFFDNIYSYTLVEDGIGLCLNKLDNHYMSHSAKNTNIIYNSKRNIVICEFTCSTCGFEYAIKGKKDDIISLNNLFKNIISELDLQNILEEKKLKVYYNKSDYSKKDIRHKDFEKIRDKHRKTWLQYKKDNPDKSKSEMARHCNTAVTWLSKHDSEWLNHNSPELRKPLYKFNRVNWDARDEETLMIVKEFVENLYLCRDKPERVTLYRISYNTGLKYLNNKSLEKLPKTREYLKDKLEDFYDINIRKIKWAINQIIEKKDRNLSPYQVCLISGVRNNKFWRDIIKEEIENII